MGAPQALFGRNRAPITVAFACMSASVLPRVPCFAAVRSHLPSLHRTHRTTQRHVPQCYRARHTHPLPQVRSARICCDAHVCLVDCISILPPAIALITPLIGMHVSADKLRSPSTRLRAHSRPSPSSKLRFDLVLLLPTILNAQADFRQKRATRAHPEVAPSPVMLTQEEMAKFDFSPGFMGMFVVEHLLSINRS
jgi:hypothetical protein